MKKIIESIRSRLIWRVREEQKASRNGSFEITSSPTIREHVIYWPASDSPSGPPREIEYLHELVHALLCEQVHYQFSGHYFACGTPDEEIQIVGWACRAATDWFVDDELMRLVPDQEKAEIQEHFEMILEAFRKGPLRPEIFLLVTAGFVIAQAIKYLGVQVPTGGQITQIVDAFLSTPPENPSVQALEGLINKLLAVYSERRVRLVKDGEMEVWEVNRGGKS